MSEPSLNPLESILRLCDAAAPQPWYPRLYVKQAGIDAAQLALYLEELWLSGLIERQQGDEESGPAISLTRQGQRVLFDPETLQRLRAGQPLSATDRVGIIRQALRNPARPVLSIALVLIHVAFFVHGYQLARQRGMDGDYLWAAVKNPAALLGLLDDNGALSAERLLDGQWWRLLTAGFVHVGVLSLLLSVVFVFLAGRYVEQTWGHFRLLAIYLAAVAAGSCLGVAHDVEVMPGASGGLGGLLGAEAVWMLLNNGYLPGPLRRQARTNLLITMVLLVFLGVLGNVGYWTWLGDVGGGALTALLLQLHRFGPSPWRWLALCGFAPLVWYGQFSIVHARATDAKWQQVEDKHFETRFLPAVRAGVKRARAAHADKVAPVLEKHPTRRDAAAVESALAVLSEQQGKLNAVAEQLARAGPYGSPEAEAARRVGRAYVLAVADWLAAVEHELRVGDKRTHKDQQTLREKKDNAEELRAQWRALLETK